MGTTQPSAVPVMVVGTDGSVRWRTGEPTCTSGLLVVADCPACEGVADAVHHAHRQWHVQTDTGYLVGDLSSAGRLGAQAAATALGRLAIDWRDPQLAVQPGPEVREAALSVLVRWGLARAAA